MSVAIERIKSQIVGLNLFESEASRANAFHLLIHSTFVYRIVLLYHPALRNMRPGERRPSYPSLSFRMYSKRSFVSLS